MSGPYVCRDNSPCVLGLKTVPSNKAKSDVWRGAAEAVNAD
jgi:hypothetical protein